MIKLTTFSLFLLSAGILTSVSILSGYQVLVAIPAIYFFVISLKNKKLNLPISAWLLIGFILIALVSLISNHSELILRGKNYGKLRYFTYGFLLVPLLRTYVSEASVKAKSFLLNTFAASVTIVGIICIYQVLMLDQPRAKSLTDTLRYGYGMGMILPMLLGLAIHKNYRLCNRPLLISAIVFGFAGLYFSYTRGALLGLICALPFVIFYRNRLIGRIAFIGSIVVVLGLVCFYLFGSGQIGNRYISSRDNNSDNVRATQWEAAIAGWKEKPFLGIGYGDFINQEQSLKVKYNIKHQEYKGHAHNILLEVLVGTGVLGLIFFVGWLIAWAREIFSSNSEILKGTIIPLGVSIIISGQFEVIFDANNSALMFFVYALSIALKEISEKPNQNFNS